MYEGSMKNMTSKPSLTEQIIEALRDSIVMADYAPLEKLKITELTARFDASSGIIREALSRLSAEGLVQALPQKGFVVSPVSRSDLEDLTEVRVSVERTCLAASIENGDLSWEADLLSVRHRLKGMTKQVLAQRDTALMRDWTLVHTEFHDCLTKACKNRWWLQIRRQLFVQSERYRQLASLSTDTDRDVAAEHEAISEAALNRDAQRACALIEDHMRRTSTVLIAAL